MKVLTNIATLVIAVCCLFVTGILLKREVGNRPATSRGPVAVTNWKDYARGGQYIGDSLVPVQILVFSDYQCPSCGNFAGMVKRTMEKYPQEVSVIYQHFPLSYHEDAFDAAKYAECAARQGAFESFHYALVNNQRQIGKLSWGKFAKEANVGDSIALRNCFDSGGADSIVYSSIKQGTDLGILGTPTIIVNGLRLASMPNEMEFDAMISSLLTQVSTR